MADEYSNPIHTTAPVDPSPAPPAEPAPVEPPAPTSPAHGEHVPVQNIPHGQSAIPGVPTTPLTETGEPRLSVDDVRNIKNRATTRDWLNITQQLGLTRKEIEADEYGLMVCVLGYLRDKQLHGGANLNLYLDMSEEELMEAVRLDEEEFARVAAEAQTVAGKGPA